MKSSTCHDSWSISVPFPATSSAADCFCLDKREKKRLKLTVSSTKYLQIAQRQTNLPNGDQEQSAIECCNPVPDKEKCLLNQLQFSIGCCWQADVVVEEGVGNHLAPHSFAHRQARWQQNKVLWIFLTQQEKLPPQRRGLPIYFNYKSWLSEF